MWLRFFAVAVMLAVHPDPAPTPSPAAPDMASCPAGLDRSCQLVLSGTGAPRRTPSCVGPTWAPFLSFDFGEPFAKDFNHDGSFESLLTINLDPRLGCRCLGMRVTFDDELGEFMLNIGDSPTNDAHGGDAGTTAYSAEISVARFNDGRSRLDVYSATPRGERFVENLLTIELGKLAGRRLEFQVCDQDLAFVMPAQGAAEPVVIKLRSPNSGRLFALGGQERTAILGQPSVGDYRVFLGINRVIHDREGVPSHNRFGRGAKEVELFLTP